MLISIFFSNTVILKNLVVPLLNQTIHIYKRFFDDLKEFNKIYPKNEYTQK